MNFEGRGRSWTKERERSFPTATLALQFPEVCSVEHQFKEMLIGVINKRLCDEKKCAKRWVKHQANTKLECSIKDNREKKASSKVPKP